MPIRRAMTLALVLLGSCGDPRPSDAGRSKAREFVEIAAEAGVTAVIRSGTAEQRYIPEVKSLGVAIFDYDGDDRPDILFTAGSTLERLARGEPGFGCVLYRNTTVPGGPIRFVDATAEAKLPSSPWAGGPCVADYDDDGDLDVFVTGFRGARLWRNRGDGTFEDATEEAGAGVPGWSTGAAFADLDGDGDLDLYVARYLAFDAADPPRHGARTTCLWNDREVLCGPRGMPAEPDVVLRNDGGRFTNVGAEWGFGSAPAQYGLGVLIDDFDRDGRADVFVANDSSPSQLWWNLGGRFEEGGLAAGVAYAEDGGETAGMGVDSADLNGDGFPEIVVTNFEGQPNSLFASRGARSWLESSRSFGLAAPSLGDLGWGATFEDFDLDGGVDLFVANGHVYPEAAEPGMSEAGYRQSPKLYLRSGAKFVDASAMFGAALLATKRVGRGAAAADLDGDGDLDVVVVNLNEAPVIFENRAPPTRAFVRLRLRQPSPNREAIGARIAVTAAGATIERTVRRNRSFQASDEARRIFGLGGAAAAERVDVVWPDGSREVFGPFAAGTSADLVRGSGRAAPR